jgi:hypothetical protein
MGVLRKGFTHLFAYWPSYRSTVLPGHRQGWVVIYFFCLSSVKCQHNAWNDSLEVRVLTEGFDNSHCFV